MGIATIVTATDVLASARRLLSTDVNDLSDQLLAEDIRTLQVLRNIVDAEMLRRLGAFDARGGAAADHFLSTQAWVRHNCRVSATTAHGRVILARRLRAQSLQGLALHEHSLHAAMTAGGISYEHAVTISRAVDKLPPAAHTAAEQLLVEAAPGMDPGTLKQVGDTIRETLAPELLVEDAESAHERRYVNVSRTIDGRVAIDGMLDPEGGAQLSAAVNALATPTGPDDTRTAAQRRHDALVEVIAVGLRAGELPATGGVLPQVAMTVDAGPFLPGGSGIPVARTASGLTLVGSTVERILCDASISRVVTRGASEVLDVGRASRLATPAQRRGLAIRDGGCVGYECDRPPVWTDVHHVVHWSHGGLTDFDMLCLLCRRHHTLVHDEGWVCIRDGTGWIVLPPSMARDWGSTRVADPVSTAGASALRRINVPPARWLDTVELTCP